MKSERDLPAASKAPGATPEAPPAVCPSLDTRDITGTWDYSTLPANVVLGRDCFLERRDSFKRFRSTQQPGLTLGDRVWAYTWTEFNVEPSGRLEIGDESILVGAVFMCAQFIRIGRRVVLSYNVTIADSDFHPLDPGLRIQDALALAPQGDRSRRPPILSQSVVIEDDVWIGIGAIILKGVRIGAGARVEAGTVVTKSIPPGARACGNPCSVAQPPDLIPHHD